MVATLGPAYIIESVAKHWLSFAERIVRHIRLTGGVIRCQGMIQHTFSLASATAEFQLNAGSAQYHDDMSSYGSRIICTPQSI